MEIVDHEQTDEQPREKPTCKLCLKEEGIYTCPRCNIIYCSLQCYKCEAHANCSESFYKHCFMEGLKDSDGTDRQKMMEKMADRMRWHQEKRKWYVIENAEHKVK